MVNDQTLEAIREADPELISDATRQDVNNWEELRNFRGTVYLVENDSDAIFLRQHGLFALPFMQGGNLLSSDQAALLEFQKVIIAIPNKSESIARGKQVIKIICETGKNKNFVRLAIPDQRGERVKDWHNQTIERGEKTLEAIENQAIVKPPMTAADIIQQCQEAGADDPNELIKNRVICKGGLGILAAETGCGKSSFIMQAAHYWGLGRTAFGLEPKHPFQTLIIQAENDIRDIEEEITGIYFEMGTVSQLGKPLIEKASSQVSIQESIFCGDDFINQLDEQIKATQPELVIIDPLLSFAGCDVSKQGEMTVFLRNHILPVVKKHNVALLFVHHKGKPDKKAATNPHYNGSYDFFGSSDIANAARYIINLERFTMTGTEKNIFRLSVPKRGNRLKWGSRYKFFEWADDGIYWKEVTDPATLDAIAEMIDNTAQAKENRAKAAAAEKKAREDAEKASRKTAILEMVRKAQADPPTKTDFISRIMASLGISKSLATGLIEELKAAGQLAIEEQKEKNRKIVRTPDSLQKS